MNKSDKITLSIIILSVFVVIASTSYLFLWKKDFTFVLEAYCDPEYEICHYRDCSNPDDCPPNQLEYYRVFEVPATDFPKCSDNSCLLECAMETISCAEIICEEDDENTCNIPADTELKPQ